MSNQTIRTKATENRVRLWQIADALGITDSTFSRKLRKELPDNEKQKIFKIIDEIAKGEN